jgi:hypothetical protein
MHLRLFALFVLSLAPCIRPAVAQTESTLTEHAVPVSVGLEIGQQAPAFALTDQFGHEQSNETLKGSKGTVLLFFRSADW